MAEPRFIVRAYQSVEPDTPPGERWVAHAWDSQGRRQVAVCFGADERCAERLAAFLTDQIARTGAGNRGASLAKARQVAAERRRRAGGG